MHSNLRLLIAVVGVVAPALAQIDGLALSSDLNARYGPALARKTYAVPAGEMIVDYGASEHVCRIHLPPTAPEGQSGVRSPTAMDNFILELVLLARRGKELGRSATSAGAASVVSVSYENVTITEIF